MAKRVEEIMDGSKVDEWRHIKGTMNLADIGARGVTVRQLLKSEWLKDPAWLKLNPTNWPEQAKLVDEEDIILTTNPTQSVIDWSSFSKFRKIFNVIVFCLSFRSKQRGVVTALERQRAELVNALPSWLANLKALLERK